MFSVYSCLNCNRLFVTRLSNFGRERVPHVGPRDSKSPVARSLKSELWNYVGTMELLYADDLVLVTER